MSKYIRIDTLFRPSKFESYVNEKDLDDDPIRRLLIKEKMV